MGSTPQSLSNHVFIILEIYQKNNLTFKDTETISHSFILSHVDYCNSCFTCLNQKSVDQLHTEQNSAARFLTRTQKREHITVVLASLRWLPVCFRIDCKILLIIFKVHDLSPCYILVLYASAHTSSLLCVPDVLENLA